VDSFVVFITSLGILDFKKKNLLYNNAMVLRGRYGMYLSNDLKNG
jgi:hypothetical protein